MAVSAVQTLRLASAARRRALVAAVIRSSGLLLTVAGAVDAALIILARRGYLTLSDQELLILAGAVPVAALAAASAWSWKNRWSPMRAAIEVDQRLLLKDRLSSGLALAGASSSPGFALLAITDAEALAPTIAGDHGLVRALPIRFGRTWFTAAAAALVAASAWFLPQQTSTAHREQLARIADRTEASAIVQQAADAARELVQNSELDQSRAALAQRQLQELDSITRELGSAGGSKAPQEAIVESSRTLEKLAGEVARSAQEDAGRVQEARRQLARAARQDGEQGDVASPTAQDLQRALREGDLTRARDAAQKLSQELDALPPAERETLAKDLERMADQLEKPAAENSAPAPAP
ncbi:MAG TPA: hypothetical protein VK176_02495, partial [Phycisphaerales bacterium]|nr:hypothetical protein [Phycisphaerales bacterium]